MRKFISILCCLFSLGTLFMSCDIQKNYNVLLKTIEEDGDKREVSIIVKEDEIKLSNPVLSLTFINNTDSEVVYGEEIKLFKKEADGELKEIKDSEDDSGWKEISQILLSREQSEQVINLKKHFGVLTEGDYKVSKDFYIEGRKIEITAEFQLLKKSK